MTTATAKEPVLGMILAACVPGRIRVFSGRIPVPYEGLVRYVVDAGMSPVEGRVVVSRTGEGVPDAVVVL